MLPEADLFGVRPVILSAGHVLILNLVELLEFALESLLSLGDDALVVGENASWPR